MKNNNIDNGPQSKRKLTKEELLQGKIEPDEETDKTRDPRIKSPDELLMQLLAQKKGGMGSPKPVKDQSPEMVDPKEPEPSQSKSILDEPVIQLPIEKQAVPDPSINQINQNTKGLHLQEIQTKKWLALKEMYDRDMARWKEYEQNVIHWRDKVLQIVHRLQNELATAKSLQDEVEALKSVVKSKDEEIAKIKKKIAQIVSDKDKES